MISINSLLGDLEKDWNEKFSYLRDDWEGLREHEVEAVLKFIKERERRLISLIVEEINRLQVEVIGCWEPNENGMYSRGLEDLKQSLITSNEGRE